MCLAYMQNALDVKYLAITRDKWISGGYLIMTRNILIAFAEIIAVIDIVFSIGKFEGMICK